MRHFNLPFFIALPLLSCAAFGQGTPPSAELPAAGDQTAADGALRKRLGEGVESYAASLEGLSYELNATLHFFDPKGSVTTKMAHSGEVWILGGFIQTNQETHSWKDNQPTLLHGGRVMSVLGPEYVAWKLPVGESIERYRFNEGDEQKRQLRTMWAYYGHELHSGAFDLATSPEHGRTADGRTAIGSFLLTPEKTEKEGTTTIKQLGENPERYLVRHETPKGTFEFELQSCTTGFAKTMFRAYDPKGRLRGENQVTMGIEPLRGALGLDVPSSSTVRYTNVTSPEASDTYVYLEILATATNFRDGRIDTTKENWLPTALADANAVIDEMEVDKVGVAKKISR